MKKILGTTAIMTLSVLSLITPVQSTAQDAPPLEPKPLQLNFNAQPTSVPTPPKVSAQAYMLIDANSGAVLAEFNPDQRRSPASLTKLMTMYIVSSALSQKQVKLDDQVMISKNAWQTGGSRMFVKVGETVPVRDLIQGIVVVSGNDSCVAMAEHLAGSEDTFADLMNQQAKLLGMNSSHFTDSTGMPNPDHFVTARDLTTLARAIIHDYPNDFGWYSQKWFTHNGIKQPNRNRLLWRDPLVDGMKTGHTDDAGFCMVASAHKDSMRLIAVVMGEANPSIRADDSEALLTYGFRFYDTQKLYRANQSISNPRVWMGENATVHLGMMKDLYLTYPRSQFKNLSATLQLDDQLKAPITRGQQLGKIVIYSNQKVILVKPVYALEDNARGGIFTRMRDRFTMKIKKWLGTNDEANNVNSRAAKE